MVIIQDGRKRKQEKYKEALETISKQVEKLSAKHKAIWEQEVECLELLAEELDEEL